MIHLFDQPVQPPLGLNPVQRAARFIARATFARGQIGEVDLRNSQTSDLVEGSPTSGWASIVSPSVMGTYGGPPQVVTRTALALLAKGFCDYQGIVQVASTTIQKGDLVTISDAQPGRRIYGIALSNASGGYADVLWDGVYGLGQLMSPGGGGVNAPPVAAIVPDVSSGVVPFTVLFDASTSTDDSAIIKYEFDFGDGFGFQDNGASSSVNLLIEFAGTRTITVRVTDDGAPALQDTAFCTILATDPGGGGHGDPTGGSGSSVAR